MNGVYKGVEISDGEQIEQRCCSHAEREVLTGIIPTVEERAPRLHGIETTLRHRENMRLVPVLALKVDHEELDFMSFRIAFCPWCGTPLKEREVCDPTKPAVIVTPD